MGLRGIGAGPYRVPHLPPPSRLEHKIKCPGCGRWFISSRRDAVVCGATCHQRVVRAHRREEKLNGMQVRRDLKPKAIVRPKHEQPPPDEVLVSADAVRLFKKMCALELELRCDCPDDTGDPDTMCANCKKLWRMNSKLCDFLTCPIGSLLTRIRLGNRAGLIHRPSLDFICWKKLRRWRSKNDGCAMRPSMNWR